MELLFSQCIVAYDTGHLPEPGHLQDQLAWFYDVYPVFVHIWKEKERNAQFKGLAELLQSHAEMVLSPWKKSKD